MRTVRSFAIWLAVAAITGACANASPGAGSQPPAGSESGVASQAPGVSQQPGASEPAASAGSGANGSIKYQITGEYTGSGELPFLPTYGDYSSYFTPGEGAGWNAMFQDPANPDDHQISLNTKTTLGEELFYRDQPIVVALSGATSSPDECTFTSTKNDETGLIGSVVCTSAELFQADGMPTLNVTFAAQWDAHP
jgi:hypothetical protein